MNKVYLLLGANQGDAKKNLGKAAGMISKKIGKIIRRSSLYRTAAWGNTEQPDFLNQVLVIETKLGAPDCMQACLAIETAMGRIRSFKNAPRIIDIDILFFNKETISNPNLVIPHPAIQLRRFVLVPLNELSPNFIHPVFKQSVHQLLVHCPDGLNVNKI
ncbi:MAG: 2-amino-4-hydroxy-6-hydroxymethyldihydropteridine diphosphokinase [Ferruginibacter sp.]